MDRTSSAPWRRTWISLGLGLALCASDLGCAQLKEQIYGNAKPSMEIGQVSATGGGYYEGRGPQFEVTPPATKPGPYDSMPPALARIEEVGVAMKPAEPAAETLTSGVALQAPTPLDTRSSARLASATTGVPNGSRLLASAERRSEAKAQIQPAELVAQARTALDGMTSYQVAMHRQERVNGALLPEEDVVLAVRRSPRAVRLTWPNGTNQGREVLYRADEPGGQMHIKMANPALPRMNLLPESPLVMRNSRHPVTEAGFDSLVEGLENAVNAPSASGIVYSGLETPVGLDRPAHCLVRTTPAGETWKIYLDSQSHLPTLVQAVDAKGELLERYLFQDVRPNPAELAGAEAFDPNARWGAPRGLLSRLSGGGAGTPRETVAADTTPR